MLIFNIWILIKNGLMDKSFLANLDNICILFYQICINIQKAWIKWPQSFLIQDEWLGLFTFENILKTKFERKFNIDKCITLIIYQRLTQVLNLIILGFKYSSLRIIDWHEKINFWIRKYHYKSHIFRVIDMYTSS